LPPEISTDIIDITTGIRRGFGSVRVAVTVGSTSWRTSIFPDSKTGAYLLPVKKAVRAAERLEAGDQVKAQPQIADLQPRSASPRALSCRDSAGQVSIRLRKKTRWKPSW